jgi:hypothetical protein
MVHSVFNFASIASGFAAAIVWGLSAWIHVPDLSIGWGGVVAKDDPFIVAMRKSAKLNRWAAALTGFSVLSMAAAQYFL